MKYKNIAIRIVVCMGLVASAYSIYAEGARDGVAWVETKQYTSDTEMRDWFERSHSCDVLDAYTDNLEKGYCIPKTGLEGFQRTKLYYGYETPWGYVTISEFKNGKFN